MACWRTKAAISLKRVKVEEKLALPVPEIRGVAKLQTPSFGKGEAVGGPGWYRSKERW